MKGQVGKMAGWAGRTQDTARMEPCKQRMLQALCKKDETCFRLGGGRSGVLRGDEVVHDTV